MTVPAVSLDFSLAGIENRHTVKRVIHHLTEAQIKALKALSRHRGLPMAELVRRAIDLFLDTERRKRS